MALIGEGNVLPIIDDSNPLLRQVSVAVSDEDLSSTEFHQLVQDMVATMYAAPGIGLAAPQVGVLKRVICFYLPATRDDVDGRGVPLTIAVNPSYEVLDDTQLLDFEGCLSVPGMRGKVRRARKIRYAGLSERGTPIDAVAEGWHARLFQHEFDHLNGILYPTLLAEEDALMTLEEYNAAMKRS